MRRKRKLSQKTPGMSPGSLVYVGDKHATDVKISVIDYDKTDLQEREVNSPLELTPLKDSPTVTWINVEGLNNTGVMNDFGKVFNLHPLLLEDVLNTDQRPKTDSFEECLFVVIRMLRSGEGNHEILSEQVSLVLGSNFVISFQEEAGDAFEPVRQRIRASKGRIRQMGPDYLFYALIDTIVDNYFLLLEGLSLKAEALEEAIFESAQTESLVEIQKTRTELIYLRKAIWPLREVIGTLLRDDSDLVTKKTQFFLRDVYDHIIQVIDTLESIRDTNSALQDIYLSMVSNRMNEVMKVLTIIATIFIPITFIAGIYGMNFEYMPELSIRWAYPVFWIAVLSVVTGMVVYFRRKGWL